MLFDENYDKHLVNNFLAHPVGLLYMNEVTRLVTLATDKFNTHAGMCVPVNCVKLDKTRDDWFIQVRVFD